MKRKSLLSLIVPVFVAIAYIGIEATGSWAWGIGEPELPSKFNQ